jgi:hypothetical protein
MMDDETLLVSPTHVVGLSNKRGQVVLDCSEHLYKTFRKGLIELHATAKVIWHSGTYHLQSLLKNRVSASRFNHFKGP